MRLAIFFLLLSCTLSSFAQFSDDFSDGDFTSNPEWTGETSKFQVSAANELQLYDASESGSAYLATQSQAINNASWEFLVRFEFNPSSQNYAKVYLCSDQSDVSSGLNGYFVKIGNTEDEISLYRQDGSESTEIIDGTDDRVMMDFVNVRILVTRDNQGLWELKSDTLGGTDYYTEGSITDDTHFISFYSGIACEFSATRWDKFFFDDFVVTGDPYQDEVPPELQSIVVIDNTHLRLHFSEPMDAATSLSSSNYQINNGIGNPSGVDFDGGDPAIVF